MKPRRCIIVDTDVTREESRDGKEYRYLGARGWGFTIVEAQPFATLDEAEAAAKSSVGTLRIVPVRRRDAATMRTELDGLRATDAECAAAIARWQLRAEIAETAYDGLRTEFESARHALGATGAESAVAAAMRVARERDEVRRELAELRRAIEVLIAQFVVAPVARCEVCEVSELDATERGAAGLGSTGR